MLAEPCDPLRVPEATSYDYAVAKAADERASAGPLEALATAAGYSAEAVQAALLARVPLPISIPWKPHQSQAHTNALMADITRAMSGRQKSPSNPPSNPSSFKKLSTTEDL